MSLISQNVLDNAGQRSVFQLSHYGLLPKIILRRDDSPREEEEADIMCGIAGVFHKSAPEDVKRMLSKLSHRGPDGQGVTDLPNGTLGHRRLAILDIEGGQQPMGCNNSWITFNGEIYNYRELAREHLGEVPLKTYGDAEVVLHLYRKFGPRCVEMLDGMFAFAIIDDQGLFMARDPLGIKPLYCGLNNHKFYFASEIKALNEVTDTVHEFPAGHWFHSKAGWHSYFDPDRLQANVATEQDPAELIRTVLKDAVRKRLRADVPIGISLSGGLDSSIVAMLASEETSSLFSFAVGMEGSEDLRFARQLAETLGTHHYEQIYSEQDILIALPNVIYHLESFDPALVRSAIPNFFLAELASKHVKVILTGEGADEIYAGYDYFSSIESPEDLQDEILDITAALHNTNLQRADRIPMAFGIEARVPFLDTQSVRLALSLPAEQKTQQDRPAKHLLREAFRDDLPEEIVNRPKQKFSRGAGSFNVISNIAERESSDAEFHTELTHLSSRWGYRLTNKEALYYYKLLRQYYEDRSIFPTMGQSRSL